MCDTNQSGEAYTERFELGFISAAAARKLPRVPDGFRFLKAEANQLGISVTGALATEITRGKNKGRHKYSGERVTVLVTAEDTESEMKRYEAETGKCANCYGEGRVLAKWSKETGATHHACKACGGSGRMRTNTEAAQ